METIITLLFILLPVIFKVIEKRLKDSGRLEQAGKVHELSELLNEDFQSDDDPEPAGEPETVSGPVAVLPQPVRVPQVEVKRPESVYSEGRKALRRKASVAEQPRPDTKRKESIDPKKLVIYSELMKPKFQE